MKVAIGSYVSDGARRTINIGFRPSQIWVKGDTTQVLAQRSQTTWVERTNNLAPADSYLDGIAFVQATAVIGAAAQINSTGIRYYWCAVGDDESADFDIMSWLGNGLAGNVINLPAGKSPIFAQVKRDSTLTAAMKFAGVATAAADGTALAECFSALAAGSATLNAVNNVNQYDSAGGLGEGIEGFFAYDGSPNCRVVTWSGAASGQFIDCGCDPLAAIIVRTDTTGVAARFLTRDMPATYAAPVTNVALTVNEASLVPGGIVLGSAATLRTGTFSAIVFGRREGVQDIRPPAIIVRERKGVYLPGRGAAAQVDCGTSDATLKIDGPITIEWYGIVWADQYASSVGVHLLSRGVGPSATVGAYSWGLHGVQAQDTSWSGPQIAAITTNQWNETAPLDAAVWRTGVLIPWGRPVHIVSVHEGDGRWLMYRDGRLVKQRRNNLGTDIASGTAHRTGFGMRRNTADTTWTQAQRMIILSGRVYAAALTGAQVASRFAREVMGSSEADITGGLAESWDARNASGTSMPASVNSANNGTISAAGRVVTL